MPDQKLPIKIFSKRGEQDERYTEGGKGEPPKWLLSNAEAAVRAAELMETLVETAQVIASRPKDREFIPAVVKISLRQDALAKNHRTETGKIFNRKNEYNFIGMSEDTDLLVKIDSSDHLNFINSNLQKAASFVWGISAIQSMEPFRPDIELPTDNNTSLKVKLINFQDRSLNESVEQVFEQTLNRLNVKLTKKTRYSSDITVFKLRNVRAEALEEIQGFEALFSLTPMPSYTVTQDEVGTGSNIPLKEPVPGEEYPTVGILDSGIEPIEHLNPWLDPRRFSAYDDDDIDRGHGTFVAGITLYGDELEKQGWVNVGAVRLLDATVFPKPGVFVDEDQLIDNIDGAIRKYLDIKIWNLSLGTRTECSNYEFSDFGKA